MNTQDVTQLVPTEQVRRLIHLARGEKVLLDVDLAVLYGVTTGNLNKAIRELSAPPAPPRREMGFHIKEDSVPYRAKRK
jgi:hypothetical protein